MFAQFDVVAPAVLDEALDALAGVEKSDDCMPLGGGTNLIIDMRARNIAPKTLVSVGRLTGLRGIDVIDGRVVVGGATTVSDILRHPDMNKLGSALVDAARVFAGQMVRNTATIAGNICCGSPAADLVPVLLALDAVVTLDSRRGRREVPLSEFYTGYKTSLRKPDELLTRVSWPVPSSRFCSLFYKLARRKGDAITVVGLAVSLAVDGGKCSHARIALGAVTPYILRATKAESMLEGQVLTPELIEAAARQAQEASSPIDDVRASGEYRRHQVLVLTRRLVSQAWATLS